MSDEPLRDMTGRTVAAPEQQQGKCPVCRQPLYPTNQGWWFGRHWSLFTCGCVGPEVGRRAADRHAKKGRFGK